MVARLLGLLLLCFAFFLAYLGIRLSGFRLLDVVDEQRRLQQPLKYYLKPAAVLLLILITVDFSLGLAGAFSHSPKIAPATVPEFLLTVLGAGCAGFIEEIVFRGFLLREFTRIMNRPALAISLQAAVFACAHGWDQTVIGWLDKFLSGLLFAWSLERTKSLVPAILVHSVVNVVATLLIGMPR